MPERFKGISKRAKALLQRDEGYAVDFKRNEKIDSEDLVAFANSPLGGTLLLGVDEQSSPSGKTIGVPVGLRLTDNNRLALLSKANSCVPPIDILLFEENGSKTPFLRVEIPSGPHKPYCTSSGTYKIRDDGANKPITPPLLLRLFLEHEASVFLARFGEATKQLQEDIGEVSKELHTQLTELRIDVETDVKNIAADLAEAHHLLEEGLHGIDGAMIDAHAYAEDSSHMADSANNLAFDSLDEIKCLRGEVTQLVAKVDSILIKNEIRDRSLDPNCNPFVAFFSGNRSFRKLSDHERRELFFRVFPTAQEEDYQNAILLWEKFTDNPKDSPKKVLSKVTNRKRPS